MTRSSATQSVQGNAQEPLSYPSHYFFNRELSWLEFNRRVLQEALNQRNPLIERLKFAAIFSSNLDEFFMVRVSGLMEQVAAQVSIRTPDGRSPQDQLNDIHKLLRPMIAEQHRLFEKELRPQLTQHGIHLLNYIDLSQEQRSYLKQYFEDRIFPVLTPLAVDPAHPFPRISNLSLNLAVVVKEADSQREHFARVKVPNILPRFIEFPTELQYFGDVPSVWTGIPLEQVIAHNLEFLFPGMNIQEYYFFRVTRDADFEVQEDEGDDLLMAIEQELQKRRLAGFVVRLELQTGTPAMVCRTLMEEMNLRDREVYEIDGLLSLRDLMFFLKLPLPELKDPPWSSVVPPELKSMSDLDLDVKTLPESDSEDIFALLRERDVLLHHPYESFTASVQHFITRAAFDPQVLAIKMTLYRTSGDSPIVQALIMAAEQGKQVVALVELKARFDEENNIIWARKLENSGVHVVYGVVGLKTHTKILLVVRQEEDQIRRYVHIGTGNYNPKTAKLYTDLGLLSSRPELGADLTDLFNYLTGYSRQQSYRKLLVAPVSLRDRMVAMIEREIEHCRDGNSGQIIAKMNSLVDSTIIAKLYEASQAGVSIDLIVRGICCLRPGVEGMSENIRVISIVGRYLEHSRIFYFHNNGEAEIFIGSADWMPRNLDRRVEAVTPVEEPTILQKLKDIVNLMLRDNCQCWELQPDGQYIRRSPDAEEAECNAQATLVEWAQEGAKA